MPFLQNGSGETVVPLYIDGKPLPLDDTRYVTVRSSSRGKDVHLAQGATPAIANQAAEAAYRAFLDWKTTTYTHRRDLLLRVASILERREDEFVVYQQEETSCQESWARFNVALACRALREIASNISAECTGELLPAETPGVYCMVHKQPVGPVLAIAPWNASMILSTRALAAPIGAGCTVVFKASEMCPQVHHALVQAFSEAGLPAGCINSLQARREDAAEVTETLIAHPAIRKVAFTGSANVGRIIGSLGGKYLKPVLMELGGKSPAVILKDADLERAAALCADGAFLHHGQICMSTDRIIVVREVAEAFVACLKRYTETKYADGAGFAVSTSVAQRAHALVSAATDRGASYVVGENKWNGASGASLQPTVITDVKRDDTVYGEETFGPSASLYVVDDERAAVELANDTAYGLNAAVHSRDVLAALRVAEQIDCGQVHVNTITEYDEANAPIGGVKGSGWGRNNGKYALREFLVEKTISLHDPSRGVKFGSSH